MATRSSIITVGTTPTALLPGTDADSNRGHRDVALQNTSAVPIYLGGPGVTTATGFPLAAGAFITLDAVQPDSLPLAVVATDTATIAVLEVGI